MNKKVVVFENTVYSLFLYMLYDKDWRERSYYIYGDRIPSLVLERIEEVAYSMSHKKKLNCSVRKKPFKYFLDKISLAITFRKFDICYGNIRDLDNLLINIPKVQIEDGLLTEYELSIPPPKVSILRKILSVLLIRSVTSPYEKSTFILNDNRGYNKSLLSGAQYLNLRGIWEEMSVDQIDIILYVFGFKKSVINNLKNIKHLILTQPLSEDHLCSEELKEKLYIRACTENNINRKSVAIKPHPREQTDYNLLFPDALILPKNFPVELLALVGFTFEKVVTLFSSSIEEFTESKQIVFMGTPEEINLPVKFSSYQINRT